MTEAHAALQREIESTCKRIVSESAARRIRGTFSDSESYNAGDLVAMDGATFLARRDNPGPCPGAGWQLASRQGQRGVAGPKGERGLPGNIITGWIVDRSNFRVTPRLSDGSLGPPLELGAFFEQETGK